MQKIIYFFLACSLYFSNMTAREASLHAIIMADLSAANIERIVEKDVARLLSEISRISKYAQLEVCEKIFLGSIKDPERLHTYIKDLHVEPDDVLLFYFSGHGFRTPDEELAWPSLAFEEADVGIRFEELAALLVQKQAHLTLLFADCCNNILPTNSAPKPIQLIEKNKNYASGMQEHIDSYRKLFLESNGILMVASAPAGEYSQGSDSEGSIFTKALILALQEVCQNASPSWQAVMDKAQSLLLDFKAQDPEMSAPHPYIFNAIIEQL